jgi:hypothetical protein
MDKFILDGKIYKRKIKLEKEKTERNDKTYIRKEEKVKDSIVFLNKDLKKKYHYENDFFHIKEKGDHLLNTWIKTQKEPIIVFLSEFIPETKIPKEIEKFRPIIKTTPTISIEAYRKEKKIGEEGVEYLKRLRDKYGVIVLKVLWANLNF